MWRIHGIEPLLHQRTCGRSITIQGSLQATPETPMDKGEFHISLWIPIDQKGISLPLGTFDNFIKTNRAPFGCREHVAVQSRPLFRQWMTTKETSLDAVIYTKFTRTLLVRAPLYKST